MATKSTIIAFTTEITDPRLLKSYGNYLKAYSKKSTVSNKRQQQIQGAMESRLGKFQGMKPAGHNRKLVPDYIVDDTDVMEALSGIIKGPVTQAEAKLKRSQGSTRTTIGTSVLDSNDGLTTRVTRNLRSEVEKELEGSDDAIDVSDIIRDNIGLLNAQFGKKIFDSMKRSQLGALYYNKSKFLQIFLHTGKAIRVTNFLFPKNAFKSPPFGARLRKNSAGGVTIETFIIDKIEKDILKVLSDDKIPTVISESISEDFQKGLQSLGGTKFTRKRASTSLKPKDGDTFNFEYSLAVPSGGSIPMSKGRTKKGRAKRKSSNPQKLISRVAFAESVRRSVRQRMPTGPIGGPPQSDTVLTFRTGRFQRSVNITSLNHRQKIIKYVYNPIYQVHESTRDPRELIEKSIRSIAIQRFGKEYNILKGF